MFFSNNEKFETFLEKNSLEKLEKDYPILIKEIYNSINGNFNESVMNVNIRQNFIIMDLLERINSNLEKLVKEN